ncbi:MAG: hypothetical protein AUK59_00615 [Candidatus Altarchaeum sp. CG2_30_32_3053]|nr:MAG: hypothetical protein AUK59_00615 [Candidatus Altarchaeum sp. CG2_30_32_3053]
MKNLDDQKLKFFIAYETTTGRDIAEHLKNFFYKWNKQIPKNFSVEAFVDLDIPSGEDNERKYRYEKIKETDYFILILTPTAWEISQELKEETAAAKEMGKKILIVEMSGSIIPKELAYIHRLSKYPFEKKEEVTSKIGAILPCLYENRVQGNQKVNLVEESAFVKNIGEIINKNKRIYFYSPVAPVSCLSYGYMDKVVKLLDNTIKNDKNIFLLFCLNPTIEKMNNMLTSDNPNKDLLKDILLKDMNMLLGKPYVKLIVPFGSILQTPSIDEGIVFGENSNEAIIWWKPTSKDKIYVQNVHNSETIITIMELFNRNYNDELSLKETLLKFSEIFKLFNFKN